MYNDTKFVGEKTLERFEVLFKDMAEALKPPQTISPEAPPTADAQQPVKP